MSKSRSQSKWVKGLAVAAVGVVASVGLVACSSDDGVSSQQVNPENYNGPELPSYIAEQGKLIVVMDAETPPGRFLDDDDKTLVGWEVELTYAIGQQLETPIEIVTTTFDSMLPGIQAGRYNIAVGSFDALYQPERLAAHDFVSYYRVPGSTLLVMGGNQAGIPEDEFCGFTIGGIRGSYDLAVVEDENERCVSAGLAPVDVVAYPGTTEATLAMQAGRIDGFMNDFAMNAFRISKTGDQFDAVGMFGTAGEYSIAFQKDDAKMTEAIRWALQNLIDSGEYVKILTKWSIEDGAISEAEVFTEATHG